VSAHSDSVQLLANRVPTPSGSAALPPVVHDEQHDLDLIARVAQGDGEALRTLATRMAPRVERVARALMGGSLDARDAALHALIELLRSHGNYRGKVRLERWGDRVAAQCVMRFARAVSRRNGELAAHAAPVQEPSSERAARTFEQYLGMLSESSRQILLLRHALGFGMAELAEAVQCSPQGARERVAGARREFRGLVRRRDSQAPLTVLSSDGIGLGAQRWCALRDREALGEPLQPDEVEELALLEAREPEVWAYVAQIRALELYFDPRTEPKPPIDGSLIERAVEALEVSSPTVRTRALVVEGPHESRHDGEGHNWVGVLAWAVSVLLAAASALALYLHRPESADAPALALALEPVQPAVVVPAPAVQPRPTVESLPSALTASRAAPLRRAGKLLLEGSVLGQGDTLEALDKAGCLLVEPSFEACLAPGSALTISSLQVGARQLTLVRGRAVVRGSEPGALLGVRADGVEASTRRGAFAFERSSDGSVLRVRALRGEVALSTPREDRNFQEGDGAQVRVADGSAIIAPAPPAWLQRDWEVLASGLHPVAALTARPPSTRPPRERAPAYEPAEPAAQPPEEAAAPTTASAASADEARVQGPSAERPRAQEPSAQQPSLEPATGGPTSANDPLADDLPE
jgi:RNA polymerase sigma-70 factor, ECF subfamily